MIRQWLSASRQWRLWTHLGWRDVQVRYALTVLGPIWTVVTLVIVVGALGIVYGTLFGADLREYLPYVAAGYVIWTFIATTLNEAVNIFPTNRSLLLNTSFPTSFYALAVVWRNIIIFLMSLPIVILVSLWGVGNPGSAFFNVIPGLMLLFLVLALASYLLAIVGALIPDLIIFLPSVIFLAFLSSPILWSVDLVGERTWIYEFNPVYWMLTVVRSPLLGQQVSTEAWIWTLSLLVVLALIAVAVPAKSLNRLKLRV